MELTRELILVYLHHGVDSRVAINLVKQYIKEMKNRDVDIQHPHPMDINGSMQLQVAADDAMKYFMKKFHINVLSDKDGNVIKIY